MVGNLVSKSVSFDEKIWKQMDARERAAEASGCAGEEPKWEGTW